MDDQNISDGDEFQHHQLIEVLNYRTPSKCYHSIGEQTI